MSGYRHWMTPELDAQDTERALEVAVKVGELRAIAWLRVPEWRPEMRTDAMKRGKDGSGWNARRRK